MRDATHRSKRVAVQSAERLVALDPYMALWDEHLGVGIRREGLDDVVCECDDPLDDHFSTVDGVSAKALASTETGGQEAYLRETTSPMAIGRPERTVRRSKRTTSDDGDVSGLSVG